MSDKRHFLVVAAASRCARFFIKKALREGHDVTALCRASSDQAAQDRMTTLLAETGMSDPITPAAQASGTLRAMSRNIFDPENYATLLNEDPTIDAICCFVGVTKFREMRDPSGSIYSDTLSAMLDGMERSRRVEVVFHSSVGAEGVPGQSVTKWPANATVFHNLVQRIFPIFYDLARSENILARRAQELDVDFIVFRPASLKDTPATRQYGYSFDTTGLYKDDLPLKHAKSSIGREDVAEEMLRVATLPPSQRADWYGHGVYLVDMKPSYWNNIAHRSA